MDEGEEKKIVCHPINWCHCKGLSFMRISSVMSEMRYADEGPKNRCMTFDLQFNYASHSQTVNNQIQKKIKSIFDNEMRMME